MFHKLEMQKEIRNCRHRTAKGRWEKNLIKFWRNSNRLKSEVNLGTGFEDLNTAGVRNEMPQRKAVKQDTLHLKSCAEGLGILSQLLQKIFFYCCEAVHLVD